MSTWTKTAESRGSNSEERELVEAGIHKAVCVALIDIGTHAEAFAGEEEKPKNKVCIVWELVECPMSGYKNRNHMLLKEFTFSMHERATLRKWLGDWRGQVIKDGEQIDFSKLLGARCYLTVQHKESKTTEKRYALAGSVSKLRANEKCPDPLFKPVLWSHTSGTLDELKAISERLPFVFSLSLFDKFKESAEYRAAARSSSTSSSSAGGNRPEFSTAGVAEGETATEDDDSIPF